MTIEISPIYAALLGLMLFPFTLRVGLYRVKTKIFIGDGGDSELLRRMRAQANFCETVPLALILIIMLELSGAGSTWVHSLGAVLVAARLAHYIGLSTDSVLRAVGMSATMGVMVVSSSWLGYNLLM